MGKYGSFKKGGKSVATNQPVPSPGGLKKAKIGTVGPIKSGGTAGKGGPGWKHLPGSNSRPNANVKGKNHSPSPAASKSGPKWAHLPDTGSGTGA